MLMHQPYTRFIYSFVSHMKQVYGVASIPCPQPRILFLQRVTTRHIVNLHQLVKATHQLKLDNTVIDVANFDEGWSLKDQMIKVSVSVYVSALYVFLST